MNEEEGSDGETPLMPSGAIFHQDEANKVLKRKSGTELSVNSQLLDNDPPLKKIKPEVLSMGPPSSNNLDFTDGFYGGSASSSTIDNGKAPPPPPEHMNPSLLQNYPMTPDLNMVVIPPPVSHSTPTNTGSSAVSHNSAFSQPQSTFNTTTTSSQKMYTCRECKETFKRKHHLADHIRIHREEKPYVCTICNKAFRQKGTLTVHIRTHSSNGEKAFRCNLCPKTFNHKVSLVRHAKCHGDKASEAIGAARNHAPRPRKTKPQKQEYYVNRDICKKTGADKSRRESVPPPPPPGVLPSPNPDPRIPQSVHTMPPAQLAYVMPHPHPHTHPHPHAHAHPHSVMHDPNQGDYQLMEHYDGYYYHHHAHHHLLPHPMISAQHVHNVHSTHSHPNAHIDEHNNSHYLES